MQLYKHSFCPFLLIWQGIETVLRVNQRPPWNIPMHLWVQAARWSPQGRPAESCAPCARMSVWDWTACMSICPSPTRSAQKVASACCSWWTFHPQCQCQHLHVKTLARRECQSQHVLLQTLKPRCPATARPHHHHRHQLWHHHLSPLQHMCTPLMRQKVWMWTN